MVDQRPIDRGSDDVVARVLHLLVASNMDPPGWNIESKWMSELEKEKVDREKYLRRMEVVWNLESCFDQSVLVSTIPMMLIWRSDVRWPKW